MEPVEQPFSHLDEALGEIELQERPSGPDLYTARLKARTASSPYHAKRELYPLRHDGTEHEVSGKAYILLPDITLTVGLFPTPPPSGAIGTVTDSAWQGMRHHDIASVRGLYYEEDRALAIWEVDTARHEVAPVSDMKSERRASGTISRRASMSVPTRTSVLGNEGVWSCGQTPKEPLSRRAKPGKGKAGRMNASEPPMRLRNFPVAGTVANDDGNIGPDPKIGGIFAGHAQCRACRGRQGPGVKEASSPAASHRCGTWKPQWSLPTTTLGSRPTVRAAQSSSGTGRSKKRRPAAERHREVITGWIGHCPPERGLTWTW